MEYVKFDWNTEKSRLNKAKHGASFEEAKTVFQDENARLIADDTHSIDEDRFVLLGLSFALRLLVVCHCYRESDHVIRIISARRASQTERLTYLRLLP